MKHTSNELYKELLKSKKKVIVSFFPIDSSDCDCLGMVQDYSQKFSYLSASAIEDIKKQLGSLECPRSKQGGYKKFVIRCVNCGDVIGYIHAKDKTLKDWCNLHYVSEARLETVGKEKVGVWHGCMAVNISPLDGELGFECACGQDTRDFRKNYLNNDFVKAKMKENMIGREFNLPTSKYLVEEIK